MTRLALASRALRSRRPSPLGALVKGLLAGVVGAFARDQLRKLQRPPLQPAPLSSPLARYALGAGFGALYGVARENTSRLPVTLFGAAVWGLSMTRWPTRATLGEQHRDLHAHLAYGLATAGAYAMLREVGAVPLAALPAVLALRARLWLRKTPPGRILESRAAAPLTWFWQAADRAFAH